MNILGENECPTTMTSRSDSVSELEWFIGVLVWSDLDDLADDFAPGYRTGI